MERLDQHAVQSWGTMAHASNIFSQTALVASRDRVEDMESMEEGKWGVGQRGTPLCDPAGEHHCARQTVGGKRNYMPPSTAGT